MSGKPCVLLVEDEFLIRMALVDALSDCGLDCSVRTSPTHLRVETAQHRHPYVDVLSLQRTHRVRLMLIELTELAAVHHDQVGLPECEAHLKIHQRRERSLCVGRSGNALAATGQQLLAHVGEHRRQQRLLAGEVPVDRGSTDTCRGTDVVDGGRAITALGELEGCGVLDLLRAGCHGSNPNDRSVTSTAEP